MMLNGIWALSCPDININNVEFQIPGDIYSALLKLNLIPHPYFEENEKTVQWVENCTWLLKKTIFFSDLDLNSNHAMILLLKMVDTFSELKINNKIVLYTRNYFEIYRQDILPYLHSGENLFEITFFPASAEANERFSHLKNDVPWSEGNNKIPHMNLIRKPQFQSGWDWGPCLVPIGIYEPISLIPISNYELIDFDIIQNLSPTFDKLNLTLTAYIRQHSSSINNHPKVLFSFNGSTIEKFIDSDKISVNFSLQSPILWWTHDLGEPYLYDVSVELENQKIEKRIGIRKLEIIRRSDSIGTSFEIHLNDKIVNAKGANIIPADSIPSNENYELYNNLISDAVSANMNTIRLWGGGYFQHDYFYDICDEKGLLIWHDLMFACAQYPTTDSFLKEVENELNDQIPRLKHHASILLWCADNEVYTGINWMKGTVDNKPYFQLEYKILNQFLKKTVESLDNTRLFWPGSPSTGEYAYGGEWVNPNKGDIHYWEVCHGKKPFESFYTIQPRFCSEFGYQSYPSFPLVKSFSGEIPQDYSITSPIFSAHQKNPSGNTLIQNMFSHYFSYDSKKYSDFKQKLYLSQVQQAFAIRMGCEYWRTIKPICRGMLYWQLNDCWPVSSWSSIEYGGRWKQLHYHAKRFFQPLTLIFREDSDSLKLFLVNDKNQTEQIVFSVFWFDWDGNTIFSWEKNEALAEPDSSKEVWSIPKVFFDSKRTNGFFYVVSNTITNFWFATEFKNCPIKPANIRFSIVDPLSENDKTTIILETDKPAFFVHLESSNVKKFSDSSFILLPNNKKIVECQEKLNDLQVYQLG